MTSAAISFASRRAEGALPRDSVRSSPPSSSSSPRAAGGSRRSSARWSSASSRTARSRTTSCTATSASRHGSTSRCSAPSSCSTFRSGHAYRWTHLHHHARFPADDDIEARRRAMPWWRALLDGITLQPRLWVVAMRIAVRDRRVDRSSRRSPSSCMLAAATAAFRRRHSGVYAALMIAGSWIFPFITVVHSCTIRSATTS